MIDLLAALRRYLYIVILDLNLTSFNKNSKIKIFIKQTVSRGTWALCTATDLQRYFIQGIGSVGTKILVF